MIGRRWAIPLGGVAWAALVVAAVPITPGDVPVAAALGVANAAIGVLVRWGVMWSRRMVRRHVQA